MRRSGEGDGLVHVGVVLAVFLWFVTFFLGGPNFWVKIAFSTLVLAAVALKGKAVHTNVVRFDAAALAVGLVSAAVLYGIFWAGREISSLLFSFAPHQIGDVYRLGSGFPRAVVFFELLLVTGPAEELFWRGFLQQRLMARHGPLAGFLLTVALYTAIHVWSFNFMLVGASAVAGAFWGYLYMKLGRLDCVMVSHALWGAVIFAGFPLG